MPSKTETPPQPPPLPSSTDSPLFATFPDGESYQWTQTNEEVTVSLVVPPDFNEKKSKIEAKETTLVVWVFGEKEERIKGRFAHPIKSTETMYQLETDPRTKLRILTINLEKSSAGVHWPLLIKSGFDTPTPIPPGSTHKDMDPQSIHNLADFYLQVAKKPSSAFDIYVNAASRGCVASQMKLAAWYELGSEELPSIPVSRTPSLALHYHTLAAENGNAESALLVAEAHANGTHALSAPSLSTAAKYLDKSLSILDAQNGRTCHPALYMTLHHRLGVIHGTGGPGIGSPDPTKAAHHFSIASAMGHPDAQYNLGVLVLNGFGTPQNVTRAVALLREATKASKGTLAMPPQLKGLSDEQLDMLCVIAEKAREENELGPGMAISVESLVNAVRVYSGASAEDGAGDESEVKEVNGNGNGHAAVSTATAMPKANGDAPASRDTSPPTSHPSSPSTTADEDGKRRRRRRKKERKAQQMARREAAIKVGVAVASVGVVGVVVWGVVRYLRSRG